MKIEELSIRFEKEIKALEIKIFKALKDNDKMEMNSLLDYYRELIKIKQKQKNETK